MKISAIAGSTFVVMLWASLSLMGCQALPPPGVSVTVQQVINGQELEVAGVASQPEITERVILQGIQAPIHESPWNEQAHQQLAQLIAGQTVILRGDRRDEQGRRIAEVWHQGQLINAVMLRYGQALWQPDDSQPNADRLAYAQEEARILGLGIWHPQHSLRQMKTEMQTDRAS